MPYYAHATVMGHLGRDVESKSLPSGKELHEFSIAVSEKRGAEKVTSWFTVKAWGQMPDWKLGELKKGALVMAAGRLAIETWDKDGKQGSKTVLTADPFGGIQVFGQKDEDGGGLVSQPRSGQPAKQNDPFGKLGIVDDSEIPF